MRIAWFSPLPPNPSGIAAYSAEVTPLLAPSLGALDLFIDGSPDPVLASAESASSADGLSVPSPAVKSAQEFVWRHRRHPYDLGVYQLGNSDAHDYMWAYLFRYPGVLVLHDAQVHQARALWLLRRLAPRLDDYLEELAANHPDAPPGVGHLFAAGLGGRLYRLWPMVSLAIRASKVTIVHNAHLAARLRRDHPGSVIRHVEMGVADATVPGTETPDSDAISAYEIRRRHGIPDQACVVGAFGGITPEKRIPKLLESVAASTRTDLHVLLVGQRAGHYDVDSDVRSLGLDSRVHIAGYVPDNQLPAYLAASDVCWCLRWPSNGETSASWLRCLAAGRPTLVTALAQLQDVPTLPVNADGVASVSTNVDAVGIAIDPVDERRDIAYGIEVLAAAPTLRRTLGANARARWTRLHTLPQMAEAYLRTIDEAARRPSPTPTLPAHLLDDGTGTARRILSEIGVPELPW